MILRSLLLVLFAIVFAPDFLHAQRLLRFSEKEIVATNDQPGYDKMYEDIEILRRILDRKLKPLYPRVHVPNLLSNPFTSQLQSPYELAPGQLQSPYDFAPGQLYTLYHRAEPRTYVLSSPPSKEEILSSLEGVYLKGQGVIYTATVSSLRLSGKAERDSTVEALLTTIAQQDSEWESVRRQVRNEKEKPKKPEASKPPSLSDVLLKVLAENGHHFSQLGENESLTIVLTMHETSPSSTAAKSAGGSAKEESKPANRDDSARRKENVDCPPKVGPAVMRVPKRIR